MNRHLIPLLLLGLASMTNAELIQSPRTDLELVEGNFRFATNFLARGMFREAEVMIDIASRTATSRLNEYEAGKKAAGSESERYAPRFREYVELLKEERTKLEAERAKPLDVERALGIVREQCEEIRRYMEKSGSMNFMAVSGPQRIADAYLQDVRGAEALTAEMKAEANELESRIRTMIRAGDIRGFRYYIGRARYHMRRYLVADARQDLENAERSYLAKMERAGAFPELVPLLREELEETRRALDVPGTRLFDATGDAEIARNPPKPSAPSRHRTLKKELNATDLVGNLKRGLNGSFVKVQLVEGWMGPLYSAPKEQWEKLFDCLRGAVAAKFPEELSNRRTYHIEFVLQDDDRYDALAAEKEGRRDVLVNPPGILFLDVIVPPGSPDDAYLDFPGPFSELLVPGGKTLKIPGLGRLLKEIIPPPVPCA